jgi:hypothetical protein
MATTSKKIVKRRTARSPSKSVASREFGGTSRRNAKAKLLSGRNPQIAKADGDAPVQAYIAAMPGWKRNIGQRIDDLVAQYVPKAQKAVRWNSPFYGIEGKGWFLTFHCFTKYVKVAFLRGASLKPPPPVKSKHPDTRYYHIQEDGHIDEELFISWVKQASRIPGDPLF